MERKPIVLSLLIAGLAAASASAAPSMEHRAALQHDRGYEELLRFEASADKTITPAKVLRWLMKMNGHQVGKPSSTEFQPIVHVKDSQVQAIAAIAYKF